MSTRAMCLRTPAMCQTARHHRNALTTSLVQCWATFDWRARRGTARRRCRRRDRGRRSTVRFRPTGAVRVPADAFHWTAVSCRPPRPVTGVRRRAGARAAYAAAVDCRLVAVAAQTRRFAERRLRRARRGDPPDSQGMLAGRCQSVPGRAFVGAKVTRWPVRWVTGGLNGRRSRSARCRRAAPQGVSGRWQPPCRNRDGCEDQDEQDRTVAGFLCTGPSFGESRRAKKGPPPGNPFRGSAVSCWQTIVQY